jgi:capsular exopolysaccharide synthesis family protein
MTLSDYWRILRKRLWLIFLLVVLAGAIALYYSRQQVPLYRATATVALNASNPSTLLPGEPPQTLDALAAGYLQFMRTRAFANLVAAEMDIALSEGAILGALSPRFVRGTSFFEFTAIFPDPIVAQTLANTTAEIFINSNIPRVDSSASGSEQDLLQLREYQDLLNDELAYLDDQIADAQEQILALEQRPPSQESEQQLAVLRNALLDLRTTRLELVKSIAEVQATITDTANFGASPAGDPPMEMIDPALPGQPIPADSIRIIFAAILGALALGVTLAWLWDMLEATVKTPEDLANLYDLSPSGAIGVVEKQLIKNSGHVPLIVLAQPFSALTESFRSLRTNIQVAALNRPIRSLLVTSAEPGEGKTFVAANLAVAFAQAGYRVLLVDSDLRHPQLHKVFDLQLEVGLTELIVDGKTMLKPVAVENLRLITAGTIPANPAELLGSTRAERLLQGLTDEVDLVIYDSPPVLAVADAVLLSTRVDAVLQVVRSGGSRRALVQRTKVLLDQAGARLLGAVLNGVPRSNLGHYGHSYRYGPYLSQLHNDPPTNGVRSGAKPTQVTTKINGRPGS